MRLKRYSESTLIIGLALSQSVSKSGIDDRVSLFVAELGHFEVIAIAKLYLDEYGVLVSLFRLAITEWSKHIAVLIL
jgi:hypothetical protein